MGGDGRDGRVRESMRGVARRAVLAGGNVVQEGWRERSFEAKGLPGDWVTAIDLASEEAIRALLSAETPAIPMRGEEMGGALGGLRWVVDPLDGTTNFIHGFPAVGVSVALVEGNTVVAGAIGAPMMGEVWHAAAGGGAVWEKVEGAAGSASASRAGSGSESRSASGGSSSEPLALRVSSRAPEHAVVGTGFPFRHKERLPRYLQVMEQVLARVEDLRRPGAACLDLAWVASGVFDGFFELGLSEWDVAAGGLLIQEAGGVVTDWSGGDGWLGGDIVAGPPAVWEVLIGVIRAGGAGGADRAGPPPVKR